MQRRSLLLASLSLLLPAAACSRESATKPGRDGPRHPALERVFYEQAAAGHWYVVGGSVFARVERGFATLAIPARLGEAAGELHLRSSKHFDSLDVSPDGEHFAALSFAFGAPFEDAHLLIFDREFNVQYEDRRETNVGQKSLGTRSAVRWSPDGKLLAYAQSGAVWIIDPTVGGRRAVADDHQRELSFAAPSWGPDGTLVYENADKQLILLELADGSKRKLADGRFPSWSPDGSKIAFRKDSGEVFSYELGSGRETELFKLGSHTPEYLWTPDSRYLLVAQPVHNSWKSNYFAFVFAEPQLFDLGVRGETLDGRLVEALPRWLEDRLLPLAPTQAPE